MQIKQNFIDRAVGVFSPGAQIKRLKQRATISAMSEGGYIVPGGRQKSMKGFSAITQDPDTDQLPKLDGSRAASRDMYMNTALATAAIRRARTNVAGAGLKFQSRVDHEYLGLTLEEADAWEKNFEREFETWAESKFSDITGGLNFYENQGLAVVSAFMNGDAFFMLPWQKPYRSGNWPYDLRVKLIEADLVRNPIGFESSGYYISDEGHPGGIERNRRGEIIAVHVANHYPTRHPKEGSKFQRIDIRGKSGRPNIYHLADFDRIGQRRGMPWLASVIGPMKQATRLSEAVLMKALVSSLYTVFIKDMSGLGAAPMEGFTPGETVTGGGSYGPDGEPAAKNQDDAFDYEMGQATIVELDDDKEIQIADPRGTDKEFEPYFNSLVTQIAAAAEIPAEQLLLKFNTSYSSARAALLEAWKFWRTKRTWLARNFCQPVLDSFLEELILKGRIQAPGFFDDAVIRAAWTRGVWVGAGNGQIDPLKETKASQLKIEANLSTHEDEYMADTGGKWDAAMERRAREKTRLEKLGLYTDVVETSQKLEDPNATEPQPEDDPEDTNKDDNNTPKQEGNK